MGVTIHYRGKLDQLSQVEDLEDRILELALALGGTGRVWRSTPGGAPERMFRGIVQEATSLIVSPEGWLLGLHDLEVAGLRGFSTPPWVQVKTGLGSMEGHVALIEMFRELKRQFVSDLAVQDETGYWDSGDGLQLARDWSALAGQELQPAFRGLSGEAAEDPEIVASRLARLVAVVRQTIGQPAQLLDPSGGPRLDPPRSPEERTPEQRWEQIERFRRRMQERLQRSIQERLVAGESIEQAIRGALESAGLPRPEELRLILPEELSGSPVSRIGPQRMTRIRKPPVCSMRPTSSWMTTRPPSNRTRIRTRRNGRRRGSKDGFSFRDRAEDFPGNAPCRRS